MSNEARNADRPGRVLGDQLPASLSSLIARAETTSSPPPVEQWEPDFCGDLDMRIASDGTWFYMGSPIGREKLVRLFASVLRKDEDGKTYLVTPVEKIGIRVDDAHFLAVEMAKDNDLPNGGTLTFMTNMGELVPLDADHPMRFCIDGDNGGLKAYLRVRGRLEARLTRALMYDLVALAQTDAGKDGNQFGVQSSGLFFPICLMEEIEQLGESG